MEAVPEKRFRLHGYKASTVPSTPATLGYALDRFGTFNLPAILEPVIELAENGYQITELQRRLQGRELKNFRKGMLGPFFFETETGPILSVPSLSNLCSQRLCSGLLRRGSRTSTRAKLQT